MSCGCGGKMRDCYCSDDTYPERVTKCVIGCKVYTGGEVEHHVDCPFYPESISKIMNELRSDNGSLKAELRMIKLERESEAASNTKTLYRGTHIMKENEALRSENERLKIALSDKLTEDSSFCMEYSAVLILQDNLARTQEENDALKALCWEYETRLTQDKLIESSLAASKKW